MGTSQAEKQRTRAAILEAAAGIVRSEGVAALTISNVMSAVGLTHGGFYAHFSSRDELVAAAVAHAFTDGRSRLDSLSARLGGSEPLSAFLAVYLARQHVDAPEIGCAAPALASDSARDAVHLAAIFTEGIQEYLDALRQHVGPPFNESSTAAQSSDDIALLLCASVGAVLIARAAGESPLRKKIPKAVNAALRRRVLPHLEGNNAARTGETRNCV
jgi:TetR/AcrR family transcriptional regulator, transcriptional repressor for nem operon